MLEENGIQILSPTEKLMYLMTGFIGPECKFLDTNIKSVLEKAFQTLPDVMFDFELKLNGKITFERIYTLFVEAFESSSYGDELFSMLMMIPLAQKYDVKWRKRIWSEHCTALRFVTCNEAQVRRFPFVLRLFHKSSIHKLFAGIDGYLNPEETEMSLLKSYSQAINSNLLRKGSVPFKIAQHHITQYRAKQSK